MKVWYLAKGKKKLGPLSASKITRGLASGKIPGGTKAWKEGMDSWMPVAEIPELCDAVGDDSDDVDSDSDMTPAKGGVGTKKKKKKKKRTRRSSDGHAAVEPPPTPKPARRRPAPMAEAEAAPKPEAAPQPEPKKGPSTLVLACAAGTGWGLALAFGLVATKLVAMKDMGGPAALAAVIGILCLIWGGMQAYKAGRLIKTPYVKTSEAADEEDSFANEKGGVSAEGTVHCPELLISPVTGTPCLYYELKVTGYWKDGDSKESKEYVSEKAAAAFSIDDGSGPVEVLADEGGDIEPLEETFEETKKEGFLAGMIGKSQAMQFGQYEFHNPPMSKANEFECTEHVLLPQERLFVLGKADEGKIGPPSWTSLIISNKTRDELLSSTQEGARRSLAGGGVAATLGLIIGIASAI